MYLIGQQDWDEEEEWREYESAVIQTRIEQLSKVDRHIVNEIIKKKKIKVKVPGGVWSRDSVAW